MTQNESADISKPDVHKLHVSRIPSKFDEAIVKRILEEKLKKPDSVTKVELIYPVVPSKEENENNNDDTNPNPVQQQEEQNHRGFGFVWLASAELLQQALALQTVKGGVKTTSKRTHTMHLRPYAEQKDEKDRSVCYLWSQNRCPYGDSCKFEHVGEGGCLVQSVAIGEKREKKKGKCFMYKKHGRCDRGEDCPFSHDVEPKQPDDRPKSERDCITWKTKGKCSKRDKCQYRHDEGVQKSALKKLKKNKKKKREALAQSHEEHLNETEEYDHGQTKKRRLLLQHGF